MQIQGDGGRRRFAAAAAAVVIVIAACGGNGDDDDATGAPATDDPPATDSPSTDPPATDPPVTEPPATDPPATTEAPDDGASDGVLSVPDEFASIQAAVDSAAEGDIVLIAPGTYNEAVDVATHNLTIRGLDRDGVVLDGELELDNGIRILGADGVVVENLTLRNYAFNGVYWISSTGYRASYVNTYRTGDYGIYAFDSVQGQIEHSHTIGSRDAGIYIGQCYPCDAVVDNVVSSHNGLGYSGTDSGGNLLIVNSVWHNNRAGIVPNSGSYELCYPERETTIVGNLVYDNNQPDTPAIDTALLAQGNGILIAGGVRNLVERNRVDDHFRTGIGLVPFLEFTPNDDLPTEDEWDLPCEEQKLQTPVIPDDEALLWDSFENQVTLNVVTKSGEADIAVATAEGPASGLRNCFGGNEFTISAPQALEQLAPCEGEAVDGDWLDGDLMVIQWIGEQETLPGEVDWREAPLPELGEHEGMADPANAPARPATDVPFPVDLDAITVPELP